MNVDHIAAQLAERSYAITPAFLPANVVAQAIEDIQSLRELNKMTRAALGKDRQISDAVRRDEIFWFDAGTANSVQTELLNKIEDLKLNLNRLCFLGLRTFEGHYAHYPAGGFYARHLDKFRENSERNVSTILYLNPNWKPADGGQLRLHLSDGPVDIEPRGGTLITFLSAEIEHEVLTSKATRLSFTGWFKT